MEESNDPYSAKIDKFKPPNWASPGPNGSYLSVIKEKENIEKFPLDANNFYVFGRVKGDISIQHESCSGVHAVITYHKNLCRWFIIDLESTHGTFVGKTRIEPEKPIPLDSDLSFHFAASSRLYFIRMANEDPIPAYLLEDKPKNIPTVTKSEDNFKLIRKKRTGKKKTNVKAISASKKKVEPEYFDHSLVPGDFSGRFEYMSNSYILESADSYNNRQVLLKVMKKSKIEKNRFEQKYKNISSAPSVETPLRSDRAHPPQNTNINFFKSLRR
ncbi:hypothetical protein HZS_5538 [Henneguya salminicola]|nr:hypothetical protein HZS_5538 [Henneguya salminicola]